MNALHPADGERRSAALLQQTKYLRLPYAAVPLDPWTARHPDNPEKSYFDVSINTIRRIAQRGFRAYLAEHADDPEVTNPSSLNHLKDISAFVENSLIIAQNDRIEHNAKQLTPDANGNNPHAPLVELVDFGDPIVRKALAGLATPNQLMQVSLKYPGLESIEIAKLSHPYNFDAAHGMQGAVGAAMYENEFLRAEDEDIHYKPRYRNKTDETDGSENSKESKKQIALDYALGAMVVVRKRIIAQRETDAGIVQVVERRSLVARDSPEGDIISAQFVIEDQESPEGFERLTQTIEKRLGQESLRKSTWILPTTTSYYARRIK